MNTSNQIKTKRDMQINYFKLYLSNFKEGSEQYNLIKESIDRIEKTL